MRIWRAAALAALLGAAACGSGDDPATPAATSTTAPATASSSTATSAPVDSSSTPTAPPTAPSTAAPTTSGSSGSLAGTTIVVDPGHNGANGAHPAEIGRLVDAGGFSKACNTTGTASNAGDTESAFNLAVGLELADRLRAMGATVVLTRSDDTGWGPCIDERGRVAAEAGADALVSIHADGADAAAHGFHVIRPGAVAGYTDGIVAPSAALATEVHDALVAAGMTPATYVPDGMIERTDLGTLNQARVPAVMLEAGNMRHAGDAALLRSAEGRSTIAAALAAAVAAFVDPGGG